MAFSARLTAAPSVRPGSTDRIALSRKGAKDRVCFRPEGQRLVSGTADETVKFGRPCEREPVPAFRDGERLEPDKDRGSPQEQERTEKLELLQYTTRGRPATCRCPPGGVPLSTAAPNTPPPPDALPPDGMP